MIDGMGGLAKERSGAAAHTTPSPSGPILSGRLLCGTLLSNNLTWLERTQTNRPRVLKFSVSIESVK